MSNTETDTLAKMVLYPPPLTAANPRSAFNTVNQSSLRFSGSISLLNICRGLVLFTLLPFTSSQLSPTPVLLPQLNSSRPVLFTPAEVLQLKQTGSTSQLRMVSSAVHQLAEDVLRPADVSAIFSQPGRGAAPSRAVGLEWEDPDISRGKTLEKLIDTFAQKVETSMGDVLQRIAKVQTHLMTYLTSPPAPKSGPPTVVPNCCSSDPLSSVLTRNVPGPPPPPPPLPFPPSGTYQAKLGEFADTVHHCFARNEATSGRGFDLWAEDAIEEMKRNFVEVPSILWQEIATSTGLHVQYPSKSRSCDSLGHTTTPLLHSWYRGKHELPPMNLVIIVDAGDEMLDRVHGLPIPLTHWDIVQQAAIDVLQTLSLNDRVTALTSGGLLGSLAACNTSLTSVTRDHLDKIKRFLQSQLPSGTPYYPEVFKKAFDLLRQQEHKDKDRSYGIRPEALNVILFLTNAETPLVLDKRDLFQAVADGQTFLTSQAHIQVYALRQVYTQAAFSTFLSLADQNNGRLTARDVSGEVLAPTWTTDGFDKPTGPVGYMVSVPDQGVYGLSEHVTGFADKLQAKRARTWQAQAGITERTTREGLTLQLVTPLDITGVHSVTRAGQLGLLATTISVDAVLSSLDSFAQGLHSYLFVVEKSTGHVIKHPKVTGVSSGGSDQSASSSANQLLSLKDLEPWMTSHQIHDILCSNSTYSSFTAMLRPGRETFASDSSATLQKLAATVGHRQISGTQFVLVLVAFDKDSIGRTVLIPPTGPVPACDQVLYHRFDRLPDSGSRPCSSNGRFVKMDKLSVKFSPKLYRDQVAYKYRTMSVSDIQTLNRFVKNPLASNYDAHRGGRIQDLLEIGPELRFDLFTLCHLDSGAIWETSRVSTRHRFLGTLSGILATLPAVSSPEILDHREYKWFKTALSDPGSIVLTQEKFPGSKPNFILSTSVYRNQSVVGVIGAVVPLNTVSYLFKNQIRMCFQGNYVCEIMDSNGYILSSSAASHITDKYPWLANRLLSTGNLKPTWCVGNTRSYAHLQYHVATNDISGSSGSVAGEKMADIIDDTRASTPDCRKFILIPVTGTNILVLILKTRQPGNCPPEVLSPLEACSTGISRHPGPAPIHDVPTLCSVCPSTSGAAWQQPKVSSRQCQVVPCTCPLRTDVCTGEAVVPHEFHFCYDAPADTQSTSAQPDPPAPFDQRCPRTCDEMKSQGDCETNSLGCMWDQTQPYPVCLHNAGIITTKQTTTKVSQSAPPALKTEVITKPITPPTINSGAGLKNSTAVPPGILVDVPTHIPTPTTTSAAAAAAAMAITRGLKGATSAANSNSLTNITLASVFSSPSTLASFTVSIDRRVQTTPVYSILPQGASTSASLSSHRTQFPVTSQQTQFGAPTFTSVLSDPKPGSKKQSSNRPALIAGVVLACFAMIFLASCGLYRVVYRKWRTKRRKVSDAQFLDKNKLCVQNDQTVPV